MTRAKLAPMKVAISVSGGAAVKKARRETSGTRTLWVMAVCGGLTIIGCGFGIDTQPFRNAVTWLMSHHYLPPEDAPLAPSTVAHWRCWEMGAVAWSLLFGIYYFVTFQSVKSPGHNKAVCALAAFAALANLIAAGLIFWHWPIEGHILAVLVAALFFMWADWLLYRHHESALHKGAFFEAILMADFPVVVGTSILLCYVWRHGHHEGFQDMEAFTGGAISFQLIASNVIFVVSQGGFIRRAWDRHLRESLLDAGATTGARAGAMPRSEV